MIFEEYWAVYLKTTRALHNLGPIVQEHEADFKSLGKNAFAAGHTAGRAEAEAEIERLREELLASRADFMGIRQKHQGPHFHNQFPSTTKICDTAIDRIDAALAGEPK